MKGRQHVDHVLKVQKLALVLPCGEIAKFLGCEVITVRQWVQNDRGTPREKYHARIDLLYTSVKKHAASLPDEIELTFRDGSTLNVKNPLKLDF